MKKVILAVLILAAILTAGILETIYVEKTFAELDERLDVMHKCLEDDDVEGALDATNETMEWWDGERHKMEIFTFSPDIRQLSVALGETKGSLEVEDVKNAMSKTDSILIISANIRDILNFNLQDII